MTDGSKYLIGCDGNKDLRCGYLKCVNIDTAAGETVRWLLVVINNLDIRDRVLISAD